jgi:deoxycytidine triphosphate deaminase
MTQPVNPFFEWNKEGSILVIDFNSFVIICFPENLRMPPNIKE